MRGSLISILIGAFETVPKGLEKGLEDLEIGGRIKTIQTTTLLRSARLQMRNTPSLPSLPGTLWSGVVAPDKGPIYGLNRTKPCFFHYTDFCI